MRLRRPGGRGGLPRQAEEADPIQHPGPTADIAIHGSCATRYDGVRRAFTQNFLQGKEIGAAVAAWVNGELGVNLLAGTADEAGSTPWQVDTLSTVLSGTKGLTSTCVHQLVERGDLDLDAPVARYWPAFAQAGKQDIPLGTGMSHRSGVIGPRLLIDWTQVTDWDL